MNEEVDMILRNFEGLKLFKAFCVDNKSGNKLNNFWSLTFHLTAQRYRHVLEHQHG